MCTAQTTGSRHIVRRRMPRATRTSTAAPDRGFLLHFGGTCDNCIYGPNPEQGPAIFGQEILALNSETFSWPNPAEVDYVRGDLALVDMYIVEVFDTLPL